jgi:hypothetical protein
MENDQVVNNENREENINLDEIFPDEPVEVNEEPESPEPKPEAEIEAEPENVEEPKPEDEYLIDVSDKLDDGTPIGTRWKNIDDAKRGALELTKGYRLKEREANEYKRRLEEIEARERTAIQNAGGEEPDKKLTPKEIELEEDVGAYEADLETVDDDAKAAFVIAYRKSLERRYAREISQQQEAAKAAEEEERQGKIATFLDESSKKHPDVLLDPVRAVGLIQNQEVNDPDYPRALKTRELYQVATKLGDFERALKVVLPDKPVLDESAVNKRLQEFITEQKKLGVRFKNLPGETDEPPVTVKKVNIMEMSDEEKEKYRLEVAEQSF